jgi:DNA/RNA-binding domain of Phe-tRNA-synthetase-like protein
MDTFVTRGLFLSNQQMCDNETFQKVKSSSHIHAYHHMYDKFNTSKY